LQTFSFLHAPVLLQFLSSRPIAQSISVI